jgi:hypothetical protein
MVTDEVPHAGNDECDSPRRRIQVCAQRVRETRAEKVERRAIDIPRLDQWVQRVDEWAELVSLVKSCT